MRALLFLLLIIVVFIIIRFTFNRINQIRRETADLSEQDDGSSSTEMMVTCDYCDVHLPASEAIGVATEDKTLHFCCKDHLERFIEEKQRM